MFNHANLISTDLRYLELVRSEGVNGHHEQKDGLTSVLRSFVSLAVISIFVLLFPYSKYLNISNGSTKMVP